MNEGTRSGKSTIRLLGISAERPTNGLYLYLYCAHEESSLLLTRILVPAIAMPHFVTKFENRHAFLTEVKSQIGLQGQTKCNDMIDKH
jgi:hypothetical protein